jgi:hypothetical protein
MKKLRKTFISLFQMISDEEKRKLLACYHHEHMRKFNAETEEGKSLFASISHRKTWHEYRMNIYQG